MRQHSVTPGSAVTLVAARPTADQYLHLRIQSGLGRADQVATTAGLRASLYSVCAFHDNQLVGFGRIVGDGGLCFYVEDVMVEKASRGAGVGTLILSALLEWLRTHSSDGARIGVQAPRDTEDFFRRFGFREWPDARPGLHLPSEALQPGKLSSPSR